VILVLSTEIFFLDIQDPKLEAIFGVIHKLLHYPGFKKDFFVDFLIAAASENSAMMEGGCLLGQLISLSLVVRDDMSDIKRVKLKIEDKIKACKTQSGYNKTIQVRLITINNNRIYYQFKKSMSRRLFHW
jgi:hypothetical protein